MPELPEVERVRRAVERELAGRTITRVAVAEDRIVYAGVSPRTFAKRLRDRRIMGAGRRGKYLWLVLDRKPWPCLHFGMTGRLFLYRDARERPRFHKLDLLVEGGIRATFSDARRLGRLRLIRDPDIDPPLSALGPDVLDDLPSAVQLGPRLARRRAPIKAVLLDQALFAGVGNWMADEVLYQSAISPRRLACELGSPEILRLRRALAHVVRVACGTDAIEDRYPAGWLFHVRWDRRRGRTRRGERIVRETIGGRTAAWVPERQR